MATPGSARGHAELQAACEEGLALLSKLTDVCKLKYNICAPLSSFYMGACKMVIFTWSTKAGEPLQGLSLEQGAGGLPGGGRKGRAGRGQAWEKAAAADLSGSALLVQAAPRAYRFLTGQLQAGRWGITQSGSRRVPTKVMRPAGNALLRAPQQRQGSLTGVCFLAPAHVTLRLAP